MAATNINQEVSSFRSWLLSYTFTYVDYLPIVIPNYFGRDGPSSQLDVGLWSLHDGVGRPVIRQQLGLLLWGQRRPRNDGASRTTF